MLDTMSNRDVVAMREWMMLDLNPTVSVEVTWVHLLGL